MSKKQWVTRIGVAFIVAGMGLYFVINLVNLSITIQILCLVATFCVGFPLAIIGSCMKHEKTVEKHE